MTLRELRRKHGGMTQATLAALTGVNRVNIVRYENGNRKPRPDIAIRIAHAMNEPVSDVLEMFYGGVTKGSAINEKEM